MAEYIEREAAIESLPVAWDSAVNAIRNMPAADVVSVVRCKDCRYFKMYKCRMGYSNYDDFCSYGEYKRNTEGIK